MRAVILVEESLEMIATLFTAATSSSISVCQNFERATIVDTHYKQVNRYITTTETTILNYSSDHHISYYWQPQILEKE